MGLGLGTGTAMQPLSLGGPAALTKPGPSAVSGSVTAHAVLTQGRGLRQLRTGSNCHVVDCLPFPVGGRGPMQRGGWEAPRDVPRTCDCELIWEKALQS